MRTVFCRAVLSSAVLLILGLTSQALAQTVAVGSCTAFPTYTTIQQAVNGVRGVPNAVIEVCPGVYHEQVVIAAPLTLMGVADSLGQSAVIVPPVAGAQPNAWDFDHVPTNRIAAQILVQLTGGVVISNLTVDGTGNNLGSCATDMVGILFQNASGTVQNSAIRNQALSTPLHGCQAGQGVLVQTQTQYGYGSSVTVKNSSVHGFQKNGITAKDEGTRVTLSNNRIQGWGPNSVIAQNGIELCCGSTGSISGNSVIDIVYTGGFYGASGILLFDTLTNGGLSVSNNVVGNTQYPIVLYTDEFSANQYADGVTISSNKVFGERDFDAIDVCTNNNTVTFNTITNSWSSAIHLDASCSFGGNDTGNNNTITNNTINEGQCVGILEDSTTFGNNTTPNTIYNVPLSQANSTSGCTFAPVVAAAKLPSPIQGRHVFSPAGRKPKR